MNVYLVMKYMVMVKLQVIYVYLDVLLLVQILTEIELVAIVELQYAQMMQLVMEKYGPFQEKENVFKHMVVFFLITK